MQNGVRVQSKSASKTSVLQNLYNHLVFKADVPKLRIFEFSAFSQLFTCKMALQMAAEKGNGGDGSFI